tara:strand:+ start:478 stop:606 length:129 start_codon:yes stop_codon:yes gene_type:complete
MDLDVSGIFLGKDSKTYLDIAMQWKDRNLMNTHKIELDKTVL